MSKIFGAQVVAAGSYIAGPSGGSVYNPAGPNCVLLLHCDGTNGSTSFPDSSPSNHIVTSGNSAAVETAQVKFGTGGAGFNGTTQYLQLDSKTDFNFGMADFTVDFWLYLKAATTQVFWTLNAYQGAGTFSILSNAGAIALKIVATNVITGAAISLNTWHHVAVTRAGTTIRLFLDGVSQGSATDSTSYATSSGPFIGAATSTPTSPLNGNLDEFRVLQGRAAWTANFTPPTAPYTISAAAAFPGQVGNSVGFAAAPAYPGSLNPSPPTLVSGSAGSPNVYSFYDFIGGLNITGLSYVTLVGCRIQSNANTGNATTITNSNHIIFSYCSWTPLASLHAAPPNAAWPCAGAGKNLNWQSAGYTAYVIPQLDRYQNACVFGDTISGPITWDHCDIWGFGNGAIFWVSTTQQMTVQDCWIHDAADPVGSLINPEHTDGIGYPFGGAAPQNIKIDHTVIAAMGTTNGIANQAATSAYLNMSITNSYFAGFGNLIDICHGQPSGSVTGSTVVFTDNTLGSDIPWGFATYGDQSVSIQLTKGCVWKRNKFKVVAGGINWWTGASAPVVDGQYIWADSSWNNLDYPI